MSSESSKCMFFVLIKNEMIKFYMTRRIFVIFILILLSVTILAISVEVNPETATNDMGLLESELEQLEEYLSADYSMDAATRQNYITQVEVYKYMLQNQIPLMSDHSLGSLLVKINQMYAIFVMIVMIGAAKVISDEYSNKTLQALVSKPICKWKIWGAKMVTLGSFCIGVQGVVMLLAWVVSLVFWGDGNLYNIIVSYDNGIISRSILGQMLHFSKFHVLALIACSSMVVMFVVLFRNAVIGTGIGVVLYYIASMVVMSLSSIKWLQHTFFANVQFQLPLDGFVVFKDVTLFDSVLNVLAHTVLFFAISYIALVRRNADE